MPVKRYITMRHFDLRRKFVPITHFEKCVDWIEKQKSFGSTVLSEITQHNQENLLDAHKQLEQKSHNDSNNYRELVLKLENESDCPQNNKVLMKKYSSLLEENVTNLKTLKTFLEISLLENPISELSQKFGDVATDVVQQLYLNNANIVGGSFATSESKTEKNLASKCVNELRSVQGSWAWIEELLKCLIIHVRHASTFCQFHHEVQTFFQLLVEFNHMFVDGQSYDGQSYDDNYSTALRLATEIQAAEAGIRNLKEKVVGLTKSFRHVVPVHMRTQSSSLQTTGVLLCRYSTKEVELKMGDEVTILDRSSLYAWKIKTNNAVCITVPSIIVVVVGHDDDSLQTIIQLHKYMEDLLSWIVKLFSQKLTHFFLKVFKKSYTDVEIQLIKNLCPKTKLNLLKLFDVIGKSVLETTDHEADDIRDLLEADDIHDLHDRLVALCGIIDCHTSLDDMESHHGEYLGRGLVVQLNVLHYLLESFQSLKVVCGEKLEPLDFLRNNFKATLRECHLVFQDDMLNVEDVIIRIDEIICNSRTQNESFKLAEAVEMEKMENNNFVNHIQELSNFLNQLETTSKTNTRNVKSSRTPVLSGQTTINGYHDTVDYRNFTLCQKAVIRQTAEIDNYSEVKTSETEQYFAVQCEESKKFVIKSVVDPDSKEEISLYDSLKRGIVNASNGSYLMDSLTKETIPIAAAMSQNLIKVQSTTVKKSCEKKSSVGLVTIKIKSARKDHVRPIVAVLDLSTGTKVGLEEAENMKLLDVKNKIFKDKRKNIEYSLEEAEKHGWIVRSEDLNCPDVVKYLPETKKITYAVWGVLDRRRSKLLSFHDACREGLMDRDTATYYDLLSGKRYSIEEAIEMNFMKAEVVEDPKSVDVWKES